MKKQTNKQLNKKDGRIKVKQYYNKHEGLSKNSSYLTLLLIKLGKLRKEKA